VVLHVLTKLPCMVISVPYFVYRVNSEDLDGLARVLSHVGGYLHQLM